MNHYNAIDSVLGEFWAERGKQLTPFILTGIDWNMDKLAAYEKLPDEKLSSKNIRSRVCKRSLLKHQFPCASKCFLDKTTSVVVLILYTFNFSLKSLFD